MRFDVITLFPELFGPHLTHGVTRRAFEGGQVDVRLWPLRDFAEDNYRRVDDRPYGGGPGMVMLVEPLERALQAIRAARQLKVEWTPPAAKPFPTSENLFTYLRSTTPSSANEPVVTGDIAAAFAGAASVVEAKYDVPFQGHTAFGPAHALADPSNGQLTIYSNDMKSYGMRNGVATIPK